jgi:hypothetical protein
MRDRAWCFRQRAQKLDSHSTTTSFCTHCSITPYRKLEALNQAENSYFTMDTEAAASFSRLTLISNFGPPPPPFTQQQQPTHQQPTQQPVSPVNGQTISHSQSINSAMSLETNDDEDVSGIEGLPRQANGHQNRHRDTADPYDMDGREEDDDLYNRNIKLSKSLSVEESKKPVVHSKHFVSSFAKMAK